MALNGTGRKLVFVSRLCKLLYHILRVKVKVYLAFVCLTESYMYVNGHNISYLLISVSPLWVYKREALLICHVVNTGQAKVGQDGWKLEV